MTNEIWRPIPGFPGYEVSDHGQVRSFFKCFGISGWNISDTPRRILKPRADGHGYRQVNLRKNRKTYRVRIGNLVALAFIGPKPRNLEVCHNDGDASNDHLDNLRYDTHKANIEDAVKHGTMRYSGERNFSAKLTDAQAKSIRKLYASGNVSQKILAKRYRVNRSTISCIVTGKTFKEADGPITLSRRKLAKDEVEAIRKQRTRGDSLEEIANRLGVSKSCVSLIARNKRH